MVSSVTIVIYYDEVLANRQKVRIGNLISARRVARLVIVLSFWLRPSKSQRLPNCGARLCVVGLPTVSEIIPGQGMKKFNQLCSHSVSSGGRKPVLGSGCFE